MEKEESQSLTERWEEVTGLVYDKEKQIFTPSFTLKRTPPEKKDNKMEEDEFNTEYEENAAGPTAAHMLKLKFQDIMQTPEEQKKLVAEVEEYIDRRERDKIDSKVGEKRNRNMSDEDEQKDKRSKRVEGDTSDKTSKATEIEAAEEPKTEQLLEVYKLIKAKIIDAATRRGTGAKIQYTLTEQKIVLESLTTLEDVWAYMACKAGREEERKIRESCTEGPMYEQTREMINAIKDLKNEVRYMRKIINETKGATAEIEQLKKEIIELRKEVNAGNKIEEEERQKEQRITAKNMAEIIREEKRNRTERIRSNEAEALINRQTPDGRRNIGVQRTIDKEVSVRETEGTKEETWTLVERQKRTYAKIAGGTREAETGEKWKTPEKSNKLESMITVKDLQEPLKALQIVKQTLANVIKDTGNVRGVQPINGGGVVLRYKDENQRSLVLQELSKSGDRFTISGSQTHKPTFTVTGVWRGYLEEELKQMIVAENEDIDQEMGEAFLANAKIVTRRKCRNDTRENITFEAPPEIVKYMIRKDTINLDMRTAHISEAISVVICFNCHRYGHVLKYCTYRQTCQHCGGPHDGLECTAPIRDCVNCRAFRIPIEQRRHSARDRDCPMYVRRENATRRRIQYDDA